MGRRYKKQHWHVSKAQVRMTGFAGYLTINYISHVLFISDGLLLKKSGTPFKTPSVPLHLHVRLFCLTLTDAGDLPTRASC